MKRISKVGYIGLGVLAFAGIAAAMGSTRNNVITPTATPTVVVTQEPTPSHAVEALITPEPTSTPTPIPTPTPTATLQIVTPKPTATPKPTTTVTPKTSSQCDPNYSGCVPIASDVDCAGGSGNGPAYVSGPITVTGIDKYKLDSNGDGIACE